MWNEARWLKLPQAEIERKRIYHGDMTGRFSYFRCELDLPADASLVIDITANSRYRLWVNGHPALSGPCRGDLQRQYYETVELTPFLRPGKNVFCVQVLYCDPHTADCQTDERASIYGVICPPAGHRLAVEGNILDHTGTPVTSLTTGKADWHVWLDNSFYLKSSDVTCYLGAVVEEIDCAASPVHWKDSDFDMSGWEKAEVSTPVLPKDDLYRVGVQPRFRVRQREIPLLYEREDAFAQDFSRVDGEPAGMLENGNLIVPAGEVRETILDAGVIKNGYPRYMFSGGRDARISITYFEKFGGQGADLRRTDYVNGDISGLTDTLVLSGGDMVYEPFWVRTFRFVCLTIETKDEPVVVHLPTFRKTGYPLKTKSSIRSSAPWVGKLWEICVRTLENCMLETYMDCPYYEQLQFAMDTRLEALFTYAVSNDHALARKALIDFHYGMQPEGLTAGKYPSAYLQILSTFSLHYIMMLWEYYQQSGDLEIVRLCRGDVDCILDYYDARIGEDGLVGRLDFWEFVDWQPEWTESCGMPEALQYGASTIINLMYAYALSCGNQLFMAAGRSALAEEYEKRREDILHAVQRLCWDPERGMYREGPDFRQFTQMAQAWAIRNNMADSETARGILLRAIASEDCLQCSFSTAFEWFRALEQAGLHKEMRQFLNEWIDLLALDCTTCPETPKQARSECHAWSALPMYEMVRTMAGVQLEGNTWDQIRITPRLMDLPDLEGTVATPKGSIQFCYRRTEGNKLRYTLMLPEGLRAALRTSDGRVISLSSGTNDIIDNE